MRRRARGLRRNRRRLPGEHELVSEVDGGVVAGVVVVVAGEEEFRFDSVGEVGGGGDH